jgi:hypothetical protein
MLRASAAPAQGKHGTREWGLNDPSTLRQSSPARVADDDPRCGPSSLQRFAGDNQLQATPDNHDS